MATVSSNQLTFIDLTDQKKFSIYLTSNLPTVQVRDSEDNYNPSWADTNLVVEVKAFLGQTEVQSNLKIQWYVKDGNDDEVEISGETGLTLTINTNALGGSASKMLTYICKASYGNEESAISQLAYNLIDESDGVAGDSAVVFHVYAPNGTVFSNQFGLLEAKAVAYFGSEEITSGATYKWEAYVNGQYEQISGETNNTYMVFGTDVVNVMTYRCTMEYNGQSYIDVITFEDKSDTYVSEMLTIGGTVFKNGQGGSAVYVIVRANGVEVDSFPDGCVIGTSPPLQPYDGMYWWKIVPGSATFMKYNGSNWEETVDDTQKLDYIWTLIDKDGNVTDFYKTGKVIYLSCSEISNIGTLQCDVRHKEIIGYADGVLSINVNSGMSAYDDGNSNIDVSSTMTYAVTDYTGGNVMII